MCRSKHQQNEVATDCLPKEAKKFVDGQIALTLPKKHGERYTREQKNLALRLYHHSPRCYIELRTTFKLPSTATLSRHLMGSLGSFEVHVFTSGSIPCFFVCLVILVSYRKIRSHLLTNAKNRKVKGVHILCMSEIKHLIP